MEKQFQDQSITSGNNLRQGVRKTSIIRYAAHDITPDNSSNPVVIWNNANLNFDTNNPAGNSITDTTISVSITSEV